MVILTKGAVHAATAAAWLMHRWTHVYECQQMTLVSVALACTAAAAALVVSGGQDCWKRPLLNNPAGQC
jgi:hypothetical protein